MSRLFFVQDTTAAKPGVVSLTGQPSPPMRTPENVGFMASAYTVAAVLYGSYIVLMFRRWSALKAHQKRLNSPSR